MLRRSILVTFLLVGAALAAAGSAGAVAIPVPSHVALDDAGVLLVNTVVAPNLDIAYNVANLQSVRPKATYNYDATLTIYNDRKDGGGSTWPVLGTLVLRTPFVADPEVFNHAPTAPLDATVTDGASAWHVTAGADASGVEAGAQESGAVQSPLGSHRARVCVPPGPPPAAPALLGCATDADGDGYSNHQELLAGSDPTSEGSAPGQSLVSAREDAARAFLCQRAARSQPGGLTAAPSLGTTCQGVVALVPEVA